MSQHDAARVQLEEQLARLLKRVGRIEGDELTLGEVRRIRLALRRIANGAYGTCSTCGKALSAKRLAAMPSALACPSCSTERAGNA